MPKMSDDFKKKIKAEMQRRKEGAALEAINKQKMAEKAERQKVFSEKVDVITKERVQAFKSVIQAILKNPALQKAMLLKKEEILALKDLVKKPDYTKEQDFMRRMAYGAESVLLEQNKKEQKSKEKLKYIQDVIHPQKEAYIKKEQAVQKSIRQSGFLRSALNKISNFFKKKLKIKSVSEKNTDKIRYYNKLAQDFSTVFDYIVKSDAYKKHAEDPFKMKPSYGNVAAKKAPKDRLESSSSLMKQFSTKTEPKVAQEAVKPAAVFDPNKPPPLLSEWQEQQRPKPQK